MKRSLRSWLALGCVLSLALCSGRVASWASAGAEGSSDHACCPGGGSPSRTPAVQQGDCCPAADLNANPNAPVRVDIAAASLSLAVFFVSHRDFSLPDRLKSSDAFFRAPSGLSPPPAALA